jgi:hypothetical protein
VAVRAKGAARYTTRPLSLSQVKRISACRALDQHPRHHTLEIRSRPYCQKHGLPFCADAVF